MSSARSRSPRARRAALAGGLAVGLALLVQCRSARPAEEAAPEVVAAWETVYEVLQHPRCVNCHPAGDRPLVGDEGRLHPQNVQRGADGRGRYAMRCTACHQTRNTPGAHMPPGAPTWHLPHPNAPLVFEGLSSGELCRRLKDPAQNGGRTPEMVLEHLARDPLVLWGWDPGDGRAPVSVPHAELVAAARAWVAGGCDCPD
jgi:hypothetical protein